MGKKLEKVRSHESKSFGKRSRQQAVTWVDLPLRQFRQQTWGGGESTTLTASLWKPIMQTHIASIVRGKASRH